MWIIGLHLEGMFVRGAVCELVGALVLCNRRMFSTVVSYGICSRSVGFRSFSSGCSILVSSSSCSMVGAGIIGSVRFLLARNVVWSID